MHSMDDDDLPTGWKVVPASTGPPAHDKYYYHVETRESTFSKPTAVHSKNLANGELGPFTGLVGLPPVC